MSRTFQPQALLAWYQQHQRTMPWRGHPDPYAVWVSEIMLQQTQVDTVRPYFERFLIRFPTVQALATAPLQDVLKHWEGLGYYSRARHMHEAAHVIMTLHRGSLPRTATTLHTLPGIGPYTAAAIASICFDEPVPVVDGNVARVFARFLGWRDDFRQPAARQKLADWLTPHIASVSIPGDFNQAMMELGALVCAPRNPHCGTCPLARACHAFRTATQVEFPARPARKETPIREAVAVVICRKNCVLLIKRAESGLLGGFWELPGGVVPRAPTVARAAQVILSQTGLTVSGLSLAGPITHVFSHFRLQIRVYLCKKASGRLTRHLGKSVQWVDAQGLERLPVATAHRRALALAGFGKSHMNSPLSKISRS